MQKTLISALAMLLALAFGAVNLSVAGEQTQAQQHKQEKKEVKKKKAAKKEGEKEKKEEKKEGGK